MAEWFWTDRWMGSDGFLLPMGPRGLYREMLTQAWLRDGRLPNDHEAIRRACGCTKAEWRRCWPRVGRFWKVEGDSLASLEALGFAQPLPGQTGHRPHVPLSVRRAVFWRDGRCVLCGGGAFLQLDHVVRYRDGGSDTIENLRVACGPCNRRRR